MKGITSTTSPPRKLNRFTSLPILLDILERKELFVPDYSTWEDKNDTLVLDYYLKKMKLAKKVQGLRAICFTHDDETIHHWSYFSKGISGCCIEFDFADIVRSFESFGEFRHGSIEYLNFEDLKRLKKVSIDNLPFIKRWPYRIENEYRFIRLTKKLKENISVPIPLTAIKKITLNQAIPDTVLETIKTYLKKDVEVINRSTVYKNNRWIKLLTKKSA